MARPVLQVLIGSTRPGRIGPSIGTWFADVARADDRFEVELVDLVEVNLPLFDEPHHPRSRNYTKDHTKAWSEIVDRADAVVFVHPEYNHSVNGALTNAIDFLSQEWVHKPASFVSYGGMSGGRHAMQVLRQIVTALRMNAISSTVAVPMAPKQIDGGRFEPTEAQNTAAAAILEELFPLGVAVRSQRGAKDDAAA